MNDSAGIGRRIPPLAGWAVPSRLPRESYSRTPRDDRGQEDQLVALGLIVALWHGDRSTTDVDRPR
ncbi:hypothetical protein GWI34_03770 [Actinomadura sp. DSM 109109]|nr:hypothetical protein [Actinomadura lepetitiana]